MIEEKLLGYDIRERANKIHNLWDAERRAIFLLRVDAPQPLSVDTLVWPSVFDTGQGIGLPKPERERLHLAGVPLPPFTGPNAGLWDEASSMRRYLLERWPEPQPCDVIAIGWCSGSSFTEASGFGPYLAQPSPAGVDPRWERLGFDVGDGSLLSGLSNCGYLPEEAELLRPQWGPRLNENHLFEKLAHAFQFREITNTRVPSHAPFYVYGLYRVGTLA